jgi:hypothetical protein
VNKFRHHKAPGFLWWVWFSVAVILAIPVIFVYLIFRTVWRYPDATCMLLIGVYLTVWLYGKLV